MLHNVCVCVFNSICVCVWETREKEKGDTRRNKKEKEEDEEGGKGIGMEGKWEQKKKTGEGEEANWASVHMHTSPPPIRVTHPPPPPIRPFLQYITLHFWCLQSSGNEITAHITAAATALKKKKRSPPPEMHLAIPSSPSCFCYWSLCNDLPKDPDFLATACHQTFGRSSTFSLFVRNGSAASLLCVCHQPCCCRRRRCWCWMSQTGCKSPLIILFSSNHTT